ncbi:Crp/Fnr family transcriptional regulator [Granulosicoccus sp. 3-233]|uniref:Crp/Fnr family transcriptional regulator n=1 Tax=Granulosicoccus sp. 3-233 TaxID=3417969 RepID=UPI003D334BFC
MDWLSTFPALAQLSAEDHDLLLGESKIIKAPADTVVFGPGQKPDNLLMVLSGTVRVQHLSEKGREIVLYRVRGGQSCVLTTSCLLAHEEYTASGVTETEVQAVAIPRRLFDRLLEHSSEFRQFVFHAYSRRISDLFLMVEEVAFQRMDVRVAQKLLELAGGDSDITITHQQLSAELGTAREVISRQLAEFQRREWVRQTRGHIELINCAALETLASH